MKTLNRLGFVENTFDVNKHIDAKPIVAVMESNPDLFSDLQAIPADAVIGEGFVFTPKNQQTCLAASSAAGHQFHAFSRQEGTFRDGPRYQGKNRNRVRRLEGPWPRVGRKACRKQASTSF